MNALIDARIVPGHAPLPALPDLDTPEQRRKVEEAAFALCSQEFSPEVAEALLLVSQHVLARDPFLKRMYQLPIHTRLLCTDNFYATVRYYEPDSLLYNTVSAVAWVAGDIDLCVDAASIALDIGGGKCSLAALVLTATSVRMPGAKWEQLLQESTLDEMRAGST